MMTSIENIQRWYLDDREPCMRRTDNDGKWVKFSDVKKLVKEMQGSLNDASDELDSLYEDGELLYGK